MEKSYAKHKELAKNKEINNKVNNVPKKGNSFLSQPLSYLSVPHIAQTVVNSSALMTPEVVYSSGDDSDSDYDYGEESSDGEVKPQIQQWSGNTQPRRRTPIQTTPGVPIPCSWVGCGMTFNTTKKLYKHMSVHDKSRHRKCDECDFTHRDADGLEAHKNKVHRMVRPYKCDKCDKDFTSKKNRDKHKASVHRSDQNKHSYYDDEDDSSDGEVKPQIQLQSANTQPRRTTVVQTTPGVPIPCSWTGCDLTFNTTKKLYKHMTVHDKSRHRQCDECDFTHR